MIKILALLQQRVLRWASHEHASKYLYGLSFAEAVVFPIPPDVMLIPMCAARPRDALRFGVLTTVFSVAGGTLGYAVGFFLFEAIAPWLFASAWAAEYQSVRHLFEKWGVAVIIIAGFSPVPYKVFTFAAGALQLAFPWFVIASLVGRGGRFIIVAMLFKYLGAFVLHKAEKTVAQLGWLLMAALVLFMLMRYSAI